MNLYRYDNVIEKVDDQLFLKSMYNYSHFRYLVDNGLDWKLFMHRNFREFLKFRPSTRQEMNSYERIMLFAVKNGFQVNDYIQDLIERTKYDSFEDVFYKMIPYITNDISIPINGVSIMKWVFYNDIVPFDDDHILDLDDCKPMVNYIVFNKAKYHRYTLYGLIKSAEFCDIKCPEYD